MKTFEELGVCEEIRRAIEELGFEQPMPVQEEVIPYLLGNGNDVVALAQTGTGKTAAFGIPLLQKIDTNSDETQALILSPTRELCLQIADDLNDFSKYIKGMHVVAVYGGASIEAQIRALKHGAQIIVATPGRLIDLMHRGKAKLDAVNNVVLDEADEMLNMGFSESINEIFEGVPADRNTLLFSATMSKEIEKIAQNYLHDAKEIVIGSRNEGAENVNHIYYMVNAKDKYLALKRIVDYHPKIFAIIFCRTKIETQEIADKLIRDGYNAESLHGDLSQQQRDLTMQKFRRHLTQLLVATDVAARGLDVDDLTHVINYGMPDDIENYTHRSGRTGRAGKKGTSIAIIHSREFFKIRNVEKVIGKEFVAGEMPSAQEICKKQLFKVMDKIVKTDVDEEQILPFMDDINRYFEYIDKEDIIKKIVTIQFGKFLEYYANAPEISIVTKESGRDRKKRERGERNEKVTTRGGSGNRKVESGFKRLFINLGKTDGFYPGEIMQLLNKYLKERQEVGHIDLLDRISYIEVPERDAKRVMKALNGIRYKGREVRCNDAEQGAPDKNGKTGGKANGRNSEKKGEKKVDKKSGAKQNGSPSSNVSNIRGYADSREMERLEKKSKRSKKKDDFFDEFDNWGKKGGKASNDWRKFFQHNDIKLKGEEPDFSEEGWARWKPKKK